MEPDNALQATETLQIACYAATWILGALAGMARTYTDPNFGSFRDLFSVGLVAGFISFGVCATFSVGAAFDSGIDFSWMGWSSLAGLSSKEIVIGIDRFVLKKFGLTSGETESDVE